VAALALFPKHPNVPLRRGDGCHERMIHSRAATMRLIAGGKSFGGRMSALSSAFEPNLCEP
jgi:predicted alpha/beta-hydrolase family hydrolase